MDIKFPIPACIGIILDGNRRWAKEHGFPSLEGHRRGFNNIEPVILAARELGISHVAIFAFSTENWERSQQEVLFFMEIFERLAPQALLRLSEKGIAIRFVGQRERFSENLQELMRSSEAKNLQNPQITLWICVSYGGRADIMQAAQKATSNGEALTDESLSKNLWSAGMPDPDLIIRTGGDQRLSNFLLWQSAYSELFFVKTYWPEFGKTDLEAVLKEYAERERRMGK